MKTSLFMWFSRKYKHARTVYNSVSNVQELPCSLFRSRLICRVNPSLMSFSAQRRVMKMCWFLPPRYSVVVVIPLCFALSLFVKSNCSLDIMGAVREPRRLPGAEVSPVDFDWLKHLGRRWPSAASYLLVSPLGMVSTVTSSGKGGTDFVVCSGV